MIIIGLIGSPILNSTFVVSIFFNKSISFEELNPIAISSAEYSISIYSSDLEEVEESSDVIRIVLFAKTQTNEI